MTTVRVKAWDKKQRERKACSWFFKTKKVAYAPIYKQANIPLGKAIFSCSSRESQNSFTLIETFKLSVCLATKMAIQSNGTQAYAMAKLALQQQKLNATSNRREAGCERKR